MNMTQSIPAKKAGQKRLMILGGSSYIIPVIMEAKAQGHQVLTSDYLPENSAHEYSDGYINLSITDHQAVLAAASDLQIDGIMSYAADPGVVAAAYVAEQLGLPFQASFESTKILQNKDQFRAFLAANGFNSPEAHVVNSVEQAIERGKDFPYPAIVKPTDAAGSKGVSRIESEEGLSVAVTEALRHSRSSQCIVEEYVEFGDVALDSDIFLVNGQVACFPLVAQHRDSNSGNPFVPTGYTMPWNVSGPSSQALRETVEKLATALGLETGIFNAEFRVDHEGRVFIMELTPRGGGNRISEMLRSISNIDLIQASIRAALGEGVTGLGEPKYQGILHQEILHSNVSGVFSSLEVDSEFLRDHVVEKQLWVKPGDQVDRMTSARSLFGSVWMRFDDEEKFKSFAARPNKFVQLKIKS